MQKGVKWEQVQCALVSVKIAAEMNTSGSYTAATFIPFQKKNLFSHAYLHIWSHFTLGVLK